MKSIPVLVLLLVSSFDLLNAQTLSRTPVLAIEGGTTTACVTYTSAPESVTEVVLSTLDGGRAAGAVGTTTGGSDFTSLVETLTFGLGMELEQCRDIQTLADGALEGIEIFRIKAVFSGTTTDVNGSPQTAVIENVGSITVGFGETSYQFPEDQSGQACVVIEGNGSIEGLLFVTLTITLTDETATEADSDFNPSALSMFNIVLDQNTPASGRCFSVPITPDQSVESDETFLMTINSNSDGQSQLSPTNSQAVVTITNDDAVCSDPPALTEGLFLLSTAGEVPSRRGDTAMYGCSSGYELIGDSLLTCELGDVWSPASPGTCQVLPPTIDAQPTDASVAPDNTANFTVVASGERLTYQWFMVVDNGADIALTNGGTVFGATSVSLVITEVMESHEGEMYYVIVTNCAGSVKSNIVTITVEIRPQVMFTSTESIAVEGNVVTICLAVISGEITTPTNINLTTFPVEFVDNPPDTGEGGEIIQYPSANEVLDYDIDVFAEDVNGIPVVTLTLQPEATETCFDVNIVDDAVFDGESESPVEQVTFSYSSSSPIVARVNLRHRLIILDNDRNCTADAGLGSRVCTNTETLSVDCIPPTQVCDFNTADCPDVSDELNCPSPLEYVVPGTISEETYTNVSEVVSSFTTLSENRTFLQTMQFLNDVFTVFNSIANFTDTTIVPINELVVIHLSQTLNSLVQWQPSNLEVDTTSSIVESFEEVATRFAQQSNLTVEFTDVTIIVELGAANLYLREGRMEEFTVRAGVPASIALPPELFNQVPTDRLFIGVYFALYENTALFPTNMSAVVRNNVTRSVGTPIVAATVGPGIDFGGDVPLDPPVVITLGLLPLPENTSANPSTARCVSWDFVSDSWITDGCTTEVVNETIFRCSCTHLTNFAVLIDICQRAQDCVSNETIDTLLSFISYIGIALSCIGLVITIITMTMFKKLRERDNSKYHIQLSIAILCMLVVFAVGIERIEVYGGCVFVSILIHYFSLVSVMWMGAEALLMFQKLVIVFMAITTKFIVILSLVCWLFPLIPVFIPMIIDLADGMTPETDLIITRNVDSITGDVTGGICFLKHPGVFFGAFLAPIFAVLLLNLVIFIWVIVILLKHTRGNMKRSNQKMSFKTSLRLLVSISGVMFLFGLTWLFAALTININGSNAVRTVFQIFFAVFASFQGFFVFLFFVIFNGEARESWREFLFCGRYKSELLYPSQYKNTSSTGTGTHTLKANKSSIGRLYMHSNYNAVNLDSKTSPLSEKINGENQMDTLLTPTSQVKLAEEGVFNFSHPDIVVESRVDGDDDEDMTPPNWSDAKLISKARVKRYSTKRASKHHVEEYEIDFEDGDSDNQEVPEAK